MENYNIKRNPKTLSDEEINRHKDFSKLLKDRQKLHRYKDATRPLYKNIGFMCMMVLIGVVLLVLVLDHNEHATPAAKDSLSVVKADTGLRIAEETFPEPSSMDTLAVETSGKTVLKQTGQEQVSINYEIFKVNPENGAVLYTGSGTRLLIPALAFSDKAGKLISKEVILKFREVSPAKEAELVPPSDTPSTFFEISGIESETKAAVSLAKPVIIERIVLLKESAGVLHHYSKEKKKWEISGKEDISYRFLVQAEESEFQELSIMKDLLWEFPSGAGKPADFGYIFNRSWKGFSFKTTNKKELAIKNSNSSFKGLWDLAKILGDPKQDLALKEAFYSVYNFTLGKNTDQQRQKEALAIIENWKNSPEGKEYLKWLKNKPVENQFYSTYKISKITIPEVGFSCLAYTEDKSTSSLPTKRVLVLSKYPERSQHFSNELLQNEPSLRR